jgi:hypothetical protein
MRTGSNNNNNLKKATFEGKWQTSEEHRPAVADAWSRLELILIFSPSLPPPPFSFLLVCLYISLLFFFIKKKKKGCHLAGMVAVGPALSRVRFGRRHDQGLGRRCSRSRPGIE